MVAFLFPDGRIATLHLPSLFSLAAYFCFPNEPFPMQLSKAYLQLLAGSCEHVPLPIASQGLFWDFVARYFGRDGGA